MHKELKPSLLFIYPNQFGYHTDSYKYCEYLRDSFNITYFCFDQGFEKIVIPTVSVILLPYTGGKIRRLLSFYWSLIKLTHTENFEISFTIQFKYCFLIGLFAKSKIKILDYRSGDLRPNPLLRKLNNLLIRFDACFFDYISVISDGLRDILHLSKKETHVLPLGADTFSTQEHSFERMDLLYVGSLGLRNIEQTIEGLALFLLSHKEFSNQVTYTIIGFGNKDEENKIKSTVSRHGLEQHVRFLGRKKYTDIPPYYDSCNLGVSYVPITPYYEYQPVTKLYEYLLSGMPSIATNTFENRLVISKSNGILINDTAEDFNKGLLSFYNRRNSFNSSEIRKSVTDHTWRNIVQSNLKPFLENFLKS